MSAEWVLRNDDPADERRRGLYLYEDERGLKIVSAWRGQEHDFVFYLKGTDEVAQVSRCAVTRNLEPDEIRRIMSHARWTVRKSRVRRWWHYAMAVLRLAIVLMIAVGYSLTVILVVVWALAQAVRLAFGL